MRVDWLALHSVDEVAQAIGATVEIGMVDLMDIPGKDDFGAFTSSGDDPHGE